MPKEGLTLHRKLGNRPIQIKHVYVHILLKCIAMIILSYKILEFYHELDSKARTSSYSTN